MEPFGALQSVRVLDLTQMLAGPYGTMMLADHGAEVIKIESPSGDMSRKASPALKSDPEGTHGGYYQSINRNKKSIILDLKSETDKQKFFELVKDADVVAENFRVGVMEKLGINYEVLKEINPQIVVASLTGFGNPRTGESPYAYWPAFDVVAQAMGGIMGVTGVDPNKPTKIGPGVGDIIPGMFLAFGIVSAVLRARETGQGQFVDVSMVDSILAICERIVHQSSFQGLNPGPQGNHHPFLSPFGLFPVKDGWVSIGAPKDEMFVHLCQVLGCPELAKDERFETHLRRAQNRSAVIEEMSNVTRRFTRDELEALIGGKIPYGPVLQVEDIKANPHFVAREMIVDVEQPGEKKPMQIAGVPVKMTATPGGVKKRAPFQGEHNDEILGSLGQSKKSA